MSSAWARGVGAVVRARAVVALEDRHPDRGRGGEPEDDPRDDREPSARELGDAEEREGPHEVPLLLDRERPHVAQRRGRGELREVGVPREHEAPVLHVEQRAEQVAAQPQRLLLGRHERAVRGHDEQHQHQRGQEPARPAQPERLDGHAAGPGDLLQEQERDQEAGEDEEDVDAEEPGRGPADPAVEEHHGADRDRADPVEGRLVGEGSGGVLRGGSGAHRRGFDSEGPADGPEADDCTARPRRGLCA